MELHGTNKVHDVKHRAGLQQASAAMPSHRCPAAPARTDKLHRRRAQCWGWETGYKPVLTAPGTSGMATHVPIGLHTCKPHTHSGGVLPAAAARGRHPRGAARLFLLT